MPETEAHQTPVTPRVERGNSSGGLTTPSGTDSGQLRRAELRRIHAGRWVAWTPDDRDVAVVADSREEIQEKIRSAGIEGLKLEAVPPASSR
jgi:hypothetical protein